MSSPTCYEPVLIIDQDLDERYPRRRLTVIATRSEYYGRGSVDVYLPPDSRVAVPAECGQLIQISTPDLRQLAERVFDDLLSKITQQYQQEGRHHAIQSIIRLG